MEEKISPSQQRIDELKRLKEDKEKGIFSGIPLWEGFPTLASSIPTIDKGQVILNAAASGIGKSMITRHKDIIVPWLYVKSHPELKIDLKFVIFLLEDDKNRFTDYIISELLYLKYRVAISPKRLRSSFKDPLSDDIMKKIESIQPAIDDLLDKCDIQDSLYNSYGIYKYCRLKSEEWGDHYYTDLLGNGDVITKSQYNDLEKLDDRYKHSTLQEIIIKYNLDPAKYKDFWKYSHYTPHNPNQHVICIVDNINCMVPDKFEGSLKEAMDNFMYNYARKNIAKHWNWTVVAVQQNVGGAEEQSFTFKGDSIIEKLTPSLNQLGDSKLTQRACHLIYGLFDPSRYGIDEFMGYNINRLKDSVRFLFVLKNNDGVSNIVVPLFFIGESSYFKECNPAKDMNEQIYTDLKNRMVK